MRAGIYYRVSSEEQVDGFSLDAQRRILLEFCQAKGWAVVGEYADEGKSARGDNIDQRPQFKRMMEDAEAGRSTWWWSTSSTASRATSASPSSAWSVLAPPRRRASSPWRSPTSTTPPRWAR